MGRGEPLPTSSWLGKAESVLSGQKLGSKGVRGMGIGPLTHFISLFHDVPLKKLMKPSAKGKKINDEEVIQKIC